MLRNSVRVQRASDVVEKHAGDIQPPNSSFADPHLSLEVDGSPVKFHLHIRPLRRHANKTRLFIAHHLRHSRVGPLKWDVYNDCTIVPAVCMYDISFPINVAHLLQLSLITTPHIKRLVMFSAVEETSGMEHKAIYTSDRLKLKSVFALVSIV